MNATLTSRKPWLAILKMWAMCLCNAMHAGLFLCRYGDVFRQQCNSGVCHCLGLLFSFLLYCNFIFTLWYNSHAYLFFLSALLWHRICHCQDFTHHQVFLVPSVPSLPHSCCYVWLTRHLFPFLLPMRLKGLGRVAFLKKKKQQITQLFLLIMF